MTRLEAINYGPSWGDNVWPLLGQLFRAPLGALDYGPSWGHNLWSLLEP